jgi:hypothetical protein
MRALRINAPLTFSTVAVFVLAVLSLLAGPAAAITKPTRTVITPEPEGVSWPAGVVCEFAVQGVPDDRARQAITDFADGRSITIGHGSPTLTNVETGTSLVHRSSYKVTEIYDPIGHEFLVEISGRIFIVLFEGEPGPSGEVGSDGALLSLVGHVQFTVDVSGSITSFSLDGTSTDLCALLSE